MSWLFGFGKPPPGAPNLPPMPPPPDDDKDKGKGDKQKHNVLGYSFDSAALERAAQCAKELEKSSKYSVFPF